MFNKFSVKITTLVFASLLFCIPSFAQETKKQNLTFSLSQYTTTRWGVQGEYVFMENSSNNEAILSYLEWDAKPIVLECYTIDLGLYDFHLTFNAKYGIPSKSGKMQDSDWLNNAKYDRYNPVTIPLEQYQYDTKTNYSIHDEVLNNLVSKELYFSFNFHPDEAIIFSPFIGISYEYSSYTSYDGQYWYAQYIGGYYPSGYESVSYPKTVKGKAVSLTRHNLFTWVGFTSKITYCKYFTFSSSISLSPYAFIYSIDYHHHYGSIFLDEMYGFFKAIQCEYCFDINFNKNNKLFLKGNIFYTDIIRGITIDKETFKLSPRSTSGCDFKYYNITLGYTFHL